MLSTVTHMQLYFGLEDDPPDQSGPPARRISCEKDILRVPKEEEPSDLDSFINSIDRIVDPILKRICPDGNISDGGLPTDPDAPTSSTFSAYC
jgi:hypothetical protein